MIKTIRYAVYAENLRFQTKVRSLNLFVSVE